MAQLKQITLKDFLNRADFVRSNKVWDLINREEYDHDNWKYCKPRDDEHWEPYNYWITSMDSVDVEYYHDTYKLNFIYCDTLDVWVWANDLCCGMSFEDVTLKPVKGSL